MGENSSILCEDIRGQDESALCCAVVVLGQHSTAQCNRAGYAIAVQQHLWYRYGGMYSSTVLEHSSGGSDSVAISVAIDES